MTPVSTTVLRFGDRRVPRPLAALTLVDIGGAEPLAQRLDEALAATDRVIVLGSPADLAAVLTRLLRTDRLDVAVAHLPGRFGARNAIHAAPQRIPLIRDETGTVLVETARWLPAGDAATICGEAVVDDTVLFDGHADEITIEPTRALPGVRARVRQGRRDGRWSSGRAVQLGTTGAIVERDGVPAARPVRRSTFYRHTQGWLRVG